MKYVILVTLLFITLSLEGFTLIDGEGEFNLTLRELQKFRQEEIRTERLSRGELRIDRWQGVSLQQILSRLRIAGFDRLKITSHDRYQVRLTASDLEDFPVLIVLQRNGNPLPEDDLRLIVPGMRDMYWIQALNTIRTEEAREMPLPYFLYFAEERLANLSIKENPEPFRKKQGYLLADLLTPLFPFHEDEFLLVGRDGVSHLLDYQTYLRTAIIALEDGGLHLQGGDIPYGMWIKDIAYIQCFDRAIIFREQFADLQEVKDLLGWETLPAKLHSARGDIDPQLDFSEEIWRDGGQLLWQD